MHPEFHGAGESTTDLSSKILRGRIAGGVAILWNIKYDSMVKVIRLNVDWAIGLEVNCDGKNFIILNIYTPYESYENVDVFVSRLAFIVSFIEENNSSCIYVLGDYNADLTDKKSLFAKHMNTFANDANLVISSKQLLPDSSFTYVSEAWNTTSWLDHVVSTMDAHATIECMEICYGLATSDHIPITMVLNVNNVPTLAKNVENRETKINWSKLTEDDILKYSFYSNELLCKVNMPMNAICCTKVNCVDSSHGENLCVMYHEIVRSLQEASRSLFTRPRKAKHTRPGWNRFVAGHHEEANRAHKAWVIAGRPRQGPALEHKKKTNATYKYALRHIIKQEQALSAHSMAENLLNNDNTNFWKEVKSINRAQAPLPCNVEGVTNPVDIADLWRQHYATLFNCVKGQPYEVGKIEENVNVSFNTHEVFNAIGQLSDRKASGLDTITAEHLKLAGPRLAVLLAICFSGLLTHGILPDSLLSVVLVPVIKDKAGKVGSIDNYRPIALASILSKVLERLLLDRLSVYITTTDNQFGFKPKHSTDQCIYALKEAVETYRSQGSTMIVGFIDASRAFDLIHHHKLFNKLRLRGVPNCLIRILVYWYANQQMQVKWGSTLSTPFRVGNGVRQGGILSPALFNLYMDGLSKELGECRTGCMMGDTLINHFMYADDLSIISPCSSGFQQLLNICTNYGLDFNIKYNAKKSMVLICRAKGDGELRFPNFHLSGQTICVVKSAKYLGHILTDTLEDDEDMARQRRMLYLQANMLVRKFHHCTTEVKVNLFRTYCTPLYTAPLWVNYKRGSLQKLKVAYNDCLRILLKKPRSTRASELFCSFGLTTFMALLRNLTYKFMCRLDCSVNGLIRLMTDPSYSSVRYTSTIRGRWHECLS